jgi:hypothetical protein
MVIQKRSFVRREAVRAGAVNKAILRNCSAFSVFSIFNSPFSILIFLSVLLFSCEYADSGETPVSLPEGPIPGTTAMADGGEISFIPDGSNWEEVHIFTATGTLTVERAPAADTVRVLVVAGGGGGGGGGHPAGSGGAGGYIEKDNFSLNAGAVGVTVGTGGAGGFGSAGLVNYENGVNGGNSVIGTLIAYGGGGGAKRGGENDTGAGNQGGSSGGSAGNVQSPDATKGAGADPNEMFGNSGGSGGTPGFFGNSAGGGGGAGGAGSFLNANAVTTPGQGNGPGKTSGISGEDVLYAEGGPIPWGMVGHPGWAPVTRGSGGLGGWSCSGGNGTNGIVIVRFPWTAP